MCYEDSDVVAFLDIQPVNAGHLLVVPRKHHESLEDIPYPLSMHSVRGGHGARAGGEAGLGRRRPQPVVNSGAAAGQDVFHYHVHVIPRRAGDGFDIPLPFPGSAMPDRTVLGRPAARIISALARPRRDSQAHRAPVSRYRPPGTVDDGATVPIYYEGRLAKLALERIRATQYRSWVRGGH